MQSHLQNSRRLALTCLFGALLHPALGLDRPPQTPQQAPASPKPAKSAAEIADEQKQAETLYRAQNLSAALPLYEDLHAQQPDNNLFRERLALALLATAGGESDAAARATRKRARQLLLDAQAAGDNSNLLQVELETYRPEIP